MPFSIKAIVDLKRIIEGSFNFLVILLFIEEVCLRLVTLSKTSSLRSFCSEKLLQISKKNTFQEKTFIGERGKELVKSFT